MLNPPGLSGEPSSRSTIVYKQGNPQYFSTGPKKHEITARQQTHYNNPSPREQMHRVEKDVFFVQGSMGFKRYQ